MSYITNSAIKTYLNINTADNDDFIDSLIDQNKNYIEQYCRQTFQQAVKTIHFFGSSSMVYGDLLRFNYDIVNSITSVEYKEELTEATFTTLDSSKYNLLVINDVPFLQNEDSWSAGNYYKIIFNAGYSNVPELINKILTEMVAVDYVNSSVDAGGESRLALNQKVKGYSGTSETINFKSMLNDWHKQLDKYKIYL